MVVFGFLVARGTIEPGCGHLFINQTFAIIALLTIRTKLAVMTALVVLLFKFLL